jgi:DNA-binding transcriptional MerR regulator
VKSDQESGEEAARVVDPGVYSMGAVVKMLGIPAATLRTWEDRYGVVRPQRSAGGHRLYSRDQIDQLRFVFDQVERGASAGDAFRLLSEGVSEFGRNDPAAEVRTLIMLAERDPYAAEFSEYFLRTEGYDCLVVLDAQLAAKQFAARSPDVAVVDLLISGGAGLGLCREISGRGATTRVLAVSALDARDEAMEAGADAFLQKPYEPIRLISTVKDLLGASAYLRRRVTTS